MKTAESQLPSTSKESLKLVGEVLGKLGLFLLANYILYEYVRYSTQPDHLPWVGCLASPAILAGELSMLSSIRKSFPKDNQIETADSSSTAVAAETPTQSTIFLSDGTPLSDQQPMIYRFAGSTATLELQIGQKPSYAQLTFQDGSKLVKLHWGIWATSKTPDQVATTLLGRRLEFENSGFYFSDDLSQLYIVEENQTTLFASFGKR